jgi:hypothetical protein
MVRSALRFGIGLTVLSLGSTAKNEGKDLCRDVLGPAVTSEKTHETSDSLLM